MARPQWPAAGRRKPWCREVLHPLAGNGARNCAERSVASLRTLLGIHGRRLACERRREFDLWQKGLRDRSGPNVQHEPKWLRCQQSTALHAQERRNDIVCDARSLGAARLDAESRGPHRLVVRTSRHGVTTQVRLLVWTIARCSNPGAPAPYRGRCEQHLGTWCSGITSASHAEGPGFSPQCVHAGSGDHATRAEKNDARAHSTCRRGAPVV